MTLEDSHRKLVRLCQTKDFLAAVPLAQRLVIDHPKQPAFWHLLGGAYTELGHLTEAESAFRSAVQLNPNDAVAHYNLGSVLQKQGHASVAIPHFEASVRLSPDNAKAYNNLGTALRFVGRLPDAISALGKALALVPTYVDAKYNLASVLRDAGDLDIAAIRCQEVLDITPNHAAARSLLLRLKGQMCDFNAHADFLAVAETLGITTGKVPPFSLLHLEDNASRHLKRAQVWVRESFPKIVDRAGRVSSAGKIRVGYVSANLGEGPTKSLINGLFREHDTSLFDIHIYDLTPRRSEIWAMGLQIHALASDSDTTVVKLARGHKLDIAIDLDGHTKNARLGVFAQGIAPVQATFLGFPGSSGAAFFDYVIADKTVIPNEQRVHYSEHVVTMPHTYQPTDNQRAIAQTNTTRAEFGLPETGCVFCCFNNSYKFGPQEFDVWMRILTKVTGSVLWLFAPNAQMQKNLIHESSLRGVDSSRLIFATPLAPAAHLARQKHADLFFDTFTYNAHTTASDALWVGLPVLTKQGTQFASRVASSLLQAANLPELITDTVADYESLAVALGQDPMRLAALRAKVLANRDHCALFDTVGFTRNFESALGQMHQINAAGQPVRDFSVS